MSNEITVAMKKLSDDAVIPTRGTAGAAGYDLTAVKVVVNWDKDDGTLMTCHSGLAVAIPEGHVGLLFPRSSVCKIGLQLTNGVGVVDSDFRGEITAVFRCVGGDGSGKPDQSYKPGDRFAQLIVIPVPSLAFALSDKPLPETARGTGGYGSTGA